ncbi:MAG: biotin--[acetyl-CoA-carboxylase] ligase [Ruminococcus sp.]|nr:biotin--[acetyl-CoA-carboxylase] ligase [Ruminococcus sp.]
MQNKILEILTNSDDYVSGQDISEQLGVSRQSISKSVKALKEKGYKISSVTNKGYLLISVPNYLNEQGIKKYLKTAVIGKNLVVLDTVGSTNDYLKSEGSNGCVSGTVVAAREQTKGKGRLGRMWQTDKDDCVMFSFLLRPRMSPQEVSCITPLAGLAVCKAIREYTGLDCKIKWPNDIIVGSKKLVGILTEMSAEFDGVEYVVTGIGINAEHTSFPEEILHKATSIFIETGLHIDKNEFLACVLNHIENEFVKNDMRLSESALKEYIELCATIGRKVTFTRQSKEFSATAVGVDSDGELKVRLDDGSEYLVNSGEVVVQGIY